MTEETKKPKKATKDVDRNNAKPKAAPKKKTDQVSTERTQELMKDMSKLEIAESFKGIDMEIFHRMPKHIKFDIIIELFVLMDIRVKPEECTDKLRDILVLEEPEEVNEKATETTGVDQMKNKAE